MEFRSPPTVTIGGILYQKQIATIGNHRYIILNTSVRGKGIRVILDSSI
jgi:hypothetical protein